MKSKTTLFLASGALASLFLLASCSTSKLAQNTADDDVYYSRAVAKEVAAPVAYSKTTPAAIPHDPSLNDSYAQGYYDGSYASRLNRFYNGYSGRSYYNNYYYNPYSYNTGLSIGLGYGTGFYNYDPFYSYNYGSSYYYSPYYYGNAYGGYNSYNTTFPGYSYGGYYSPGYVIPDNSRTRPNRESLSRGTDLFGTSGTTGPVTNARPQRTGVAPSNTGVTDRVSSQPSDNSTRVQAAPPARTSQPSQSNAGQNDRPERVSTPVISQPSSSGSSSSGSSSAPASAPASSGSRPTRGGE